MRKVTLILLLMLAALPSSLLAQSDEPTATPTPTMTATAVPTTTATPDGSDLYEPNNEMETATIITLGESLIDLTLDPVGDVDYFRLYLKSEQLVRVATFPEEAADTLMMVYSSSGELIGQNDDRSETDLGSAVVWTAVSDGWTFIRVESAIPFGGAYRLLASLEMPAPTPTLASTATPLPTGKPPPTATAVPTSTPYTQADSGEPNNRPEDAFPILPGTNYPMTLGPAGIDSHDFYSLLGKAGVTYRCAAENPEGVDPTLRVYAGEIGAGVLLAENDDASAGDIGSSVTFTAVSDALIYLVVEARAGYGRYSFSCQGGAIMPQSKNGGTAPQPQSTHVPETKPLRINVFIDIDEDSILDPGEGAHHVLVEIISLDGSWSTTTYTNNGTVVIDAISKVDALIVNVPYLHQSALVELNNQASSTTLDTLQADFVLLSPLYPVQLP